MYAANYIRAMPENEKPPAMRVDIYYVRVFGCALEGGTGSIGNIHKRDTPEHKEILAEGADGEETYTDFLGRQEERDFAADGILGDVHERAEQHPAKDGEKSGIVEEISRCVR